MDKGPIDYEKYRSHYDEVKLWNKLKKVARKAGIKVVYSALVLYYMMRSQELPTFEKVKICGMLGYFILPADLLPDAVVGLGYTDDLAALVWAVYSLRSYMTPTIKKMAEDKLAEWFGEDEIVKIAGFLPLPAKNYTV